VPATLALLPFPSSIAALTTALEDPDGFIRFKATMALHRLRRDNPALAVDPKVVSRHINAEAARAFSALTLHYNLFVAGGLDKGSLLARALTVAPASEQTTSTPERRREPTRPASTS